METFSSSIKHHHKYKQSYLKKKNKKKTILRTVSPAENLIHLQQI